MVKSCCVKKGPMDLQKMRNHVDSSLATLHQNGQKLLCEKRTHGLTEDEKSRGSLAREHYTCMIQLHYLCPKSGDYYDRNESFEPPNDVVIVVHG